jgi:hypothetical protein
MRLALITIAAMASLALVLPGISVADPATATQQDWEVGIADFATPTNDPCLIGDVRVDTLTFFDASSQRSSSGPWASTICALRLGFRF